MLLDPELKASPLYKQIVEARVRFNSQQKNKSKKTLEHFDITILRQAEPS